MNLYRSANFVGIKLYVSAVMWKMTDSIDVMFIPYLQVPQSMSESESDQNTHSKI